jgi:hypothetical protein
MKWPTLSLFGTLALSSGVLSANYVLAQSFKLCFQYATGNRVGSWQVAVCRAVSVWAEADGPVLESCLYQAVGCKHGSHGVTLQPPEVLFLALQDQDRIGNEMRYLHVHRVDASAMIASS